MTKRTMAIEDALRWAYREELPKARRAGGYLVPAGPASPGRAVDMVAETWALPDNLYGVVVDISADEDPHPDALLIHEAVLELDAVAATIPEDWIGADDVDLFGQEDRIVAAVIDGLTRFDEIGQRVLRIQPSQIVRTVAILGLPDTLIDPPELRAVTGANGKPRWFRRVSGIDSFGHPYEVEVDGFDPKRRRPHADAYRRYFLEPDPVPALINRARAELWRAALDVLFEVLVDRLRFVHLVETRLPLRPWEGAGPAFLPDLTVPRWKLERRVSNRPLAGRRETRRRVSAEGD